MLERQVRDLLVDALPADAIRWGNKLTAVQPAAGVPGRWELDLDDRASVTTDLLVGADGAWSRIRALLTEA